MKKIIILLLLIGTVSAEELFLDECNGGSNFPNSPWMEINANTGTSGTLSNGFCVVNDTVDAGWYGINRSASVGAYDTYQIDFGAIINSTNGASPRFEMGMRNASTGAHACTIRYYAGYIQYSNASTYINYDIWNENQLYNMSILYLRDLGNCSFYVDGELIRAKESLGFNGEEVGYIQMYTYDGEIQSWISHVNVSRFDGTTTTSTTTTLPSIITVDGYVTNVSTNPMPDASLEFYNWGTETYYYTTTNGSGYYTIDIAAGYYDIIVNATGYGKECEEVVYYGVSTEYNYTMYDYNLEFNVREDATGNNISGATVVTRSSNYSTNCGTNVNGKCFLMVPDNIYNFTAIANGYENDSFLNYNTTCRDTYTFYMENGTSYADVVINVKNDYYLNAIENAYVRIFDGIDAIAENYTNNSGECVIKNLVQDRLYGIVITHLEYNGTSASLSVGYNNQKKYYYMGWLANYVPKYNISGTVYLDESANTSVVVSYSCQSLFSDAVRQNGNVNGYLITDIFDKSTCNLSHYSYGVVDYFVTLGIDGMNVVHDIYINSSRRYNFFWIDYITRENIKPEVNIYVDDEYSGITLNTMPYSRILRDNVNISFEASLVFYSDTNSSYLTNFSADTDYDYTFYTSMLLSSLSEDDAYLDVRLIANEYVNVSGDISHSMKFYFRDTVNESLSVTKTVSFTNYELNQGNAKFSVKLIKNREYIITGEGNTYQLRGGNIMLTLNSPITANDIYIEPIPINPGSLLGDRIRTDFFGNWGWYMYILFLMVIFSVLLKNI